MPMSPRCRHCIVALALLPLTGPAAAWTSYGEPPPPELSPGQAPPASRQAPYPTGEPGAMPAPGYGYGYGPPGGFPRPGSGYGPDPNQDLPGAPGAFGPTAMPPPMAGAGPATGGITFDQQVTDDGYVLDIGLDGIEPAQVQVDTVGRTLVVRTERSAETRREETFDTGGVMRSFSWSSGSSARRLPVPPDADLGALTREDSSERVRIVIPRLTGAMPPAAGRKTPQ